MLFIRNVPTAERIVRVLMGVALLAASISWFGPNAKGWIVGAMGMMASVSGLIGWCPMCAMAGRKPASPD